MKLRALLLLFLFVSGAGVAFADAPMPPCAGPAAVPAPGVVNGSPSIEVWDRGSLGDTWVPPSCSGWTTPGFRSLIAVAGRFQLHGGMDALLRRLGAISETAGIQFWAVKDGRWQTLIREAHAIAPESELPRPDFAPTEFAPGQTLAYSETDSGSGVAAYRMRILSRTSAQIVLEIENTTAIHFALWTLFHRGDLQSLYVIERLSDDTWLYYNLLRIGLGANSITDNHDASSINRAVAWFRHVAGIPTNQNPPAAP